MAVINHQGFAGKKHILMHHSDQTISHRLNGRAFRCCNVDTGMRAARFTIENSLRSKNPRDPPRHWPYKLGAKIRIRGITAARLTDEPALGTDAFDVESFGRHFARRQTIDFRNLIVLRFNTKLSFLPRSIRIPNRQNGFLFFFAAKTKREQSIRRHTKSAAFK